MKKSRQQDAIQQQTACTFEFFKEITIAFCTGLCSTQACTAGQCVSIENECMKKNRQNQKIKRHWLCASFSECPLLPERLS